LRRAARQSTAKSIASEVRVRDRPLVERVDAGPSFELRADDSGGKRLYRAGVRRWTASSAAGTGAAVAVMSLSDIRKFRY
jgi:hypothetical protein